MFEQRKNVWKAPAFQAFGADKLSPRMRGQCPSIRGAAALFTYRFVGEHGEAQLCRIHSAHAGISLSQTQNLVLPPGHRQPGGETRTIWIAEFAEVGQIVGHLIAEDLILINEATGLRIKDLLFAGVLISSLGAIMDVGMSIVSALFELLHHNPELSAGELFKSGIEIGKNMIGTMTNTLILAFTGSAFITLLVFVSYQVQANQLFNSNYIAIEIAQGICGTFGIVLTVPIASAVSAVMLIRNKKEQEQIVTFQTHANNKHQK